MPRYANPAYGRYPVDPAFAQLGGTLATALFGDPEARAQQERQQAEMDQLASETAYNNERTTGLRFQNDAMADMAQPEVWNILSSLGLTEEAAPQPVTGIQPVAAPPSILAAPEAMPAAPSPMAPVMPETGLPSIFLSNARSRATAPASGQPAATPQPAARTFRTPDDVTALVRSIAPGVVITSTARDPNSRLGRENPRSYHNSGRAIDMAPVPGMTFEEMRDQLRARGLNIVEAINEVDNPSAHSTGPHWHFAWGDPTTPTSARTASAASSGPTPLAQATIPDAQYVPEPEGQPIDMERASQLVRLLVMSGEDNPARILAAITGYSGDDRTARGALISQGNSPSADFAATRERADNIATRDAQSDLVRVLSQENLEQAGDTLRNDADNTTLITNNREDNRTTERGQDVSAATTRRGQDINSADEQRGQDIDERTAGRRGPGGRETNRDLSAADIETLDDEIQNIATRWEEIAPQDRQRVRTAAQQFYAQGMTPAEAAARGLQSVFSGRRRSATPAAPAAATTRDRVVNTPAPPRVGTVQEGYRFKGGDAANPDNWERVR